MERRSGRHREHRDNLIMIITLVGNATFTTSSNVTVVSATVPGGIMAGDYLLFSINTRGNGATTSTPTGFTDLVDITRAATLGRHYVFGKVADGNETTVSTTVATSNNHAAILLLLRGVDTIAPVNVIGTDTGGSTITHTAPSVTTTTNGCYIVNFAACALTGTFDYSWSPGTSIVQAKSTTGAVDNVLGSAYLTQALAGVTSTDVATMSSVGGNVWSAASIALAPLNGTGGLTGVSVLQGVSTLQL